MIEILFEPFVIKAILCGIPISIVLSGLGLFLILRRLSLIGDGLAHLSFGALSFGLFLGKAPTYIAMLASAVGSLAILKLRKIARIPEDASIAIVSSLGMAVGVALSLTKVGAGTDVFNFLFGSLLSITDEDIVLAVILLSFFLFYLFISYQSLLSTTFDENLAQAEGLNVGRVLNSLGVLTGISVVLAMKIIGVLLVTSLIVFPASISLQFSLDFKKTLLLCVSSSSLSVLLGILSSVLFDLPASSSIVFLNLLFLFLAILRKKS